MGASGVQAGRRRPAVPVALVAVITALAIAVATAGLTALAGPANAQATWPTVQRGDNGLNVQAAQNLLVADGHSIDADGVFGPATDSAARAFQTANDLDSDGVVGGDTWQALVVEVGSGDQGTAVLAMQVLLNKHGYGLEVDGIFGARSLTALEAFQDDAGLPSAGVADPGTWQQLAGLQGQTYVLPLTRHIVLRDAYGRPHHDYPAVDIPLAEGNDVFATFGGTVQIINDSLCGRGVARWSRPARRSATPGTPGSPQVRTYTSASS